MNIMNDLICELMYQQDKSIQDVCDGTGLSYNTIRNIVKYYTSPTTEEAGLIFKYLGESLEEILKLY